MSVPLALAFSANQSADGSTVTITDLTANWSGNSEGYTEDQFVKNFILTDYLGNPIVNIPMATGVYIATYAMPAATNPFIEIDFNAVGPITLDLIQKYGFDRYFQLAYIAANKASCGCKNVQRIDMCQVDTNYVIGVEFALPTGDAPNYQSNIDAAYALLTPVN